MPDSPAQSTNLQGQSLANGRFVIVNLLGSGGMADVYRAYDNRTQRDVAVKMPKLHLLADAEFVRRFDREIKIMVGLEHPHIVPVLFAGKHEEHTFAVFPYLTGGSLGDRIKNEQYSKPPTTSGDLHWLTQIAMALDHLHGQGLLHRDVKPDNILFDADGKAYLNDFGIVRALEAEKGGKAVTQLTGANATIGTPQFMALELLLAKKPYTAAVDQYALAVTVYQTLTGKCPYNGTFEQIVFQQARTKPPQLGTARPDLPSLVGEAVHRGLAKNASRRFDRCIEFAQAVVRGLPVPTTAKAASVAAPQLAPSGESDCAPTQKEALPRRIGVVNRRSAQSESNRTQPLAPNDSRTPLSGVERRPAKRWYIIGAAIGAMLLVIMFLFMRSPSTEGDSTAIVKESTPSPTNLNPSAKLEKYITNSIGMKLALIPAGKFTMGSPDTEKDRYDDESQHEVHITEPFYMGVYEVTQGQYQQVMRMNRSHFSSGGDGKDKVADMDTSALPVENVSWNDAMEFCMKLSNLPAERAAGREYCLPTEAEWEYACRGGAASYQVFHFGNGLSSTQANFSGNHPYGGAATGPYLGRTSIGGSYQPNTFGIYDMHGNVWEWCADWYDEKYYAKSPLRDPLCLTMSKGRVVRGGSWRANASSSRAAYRVKTEPDGRAFDLGFRVVCVPSGE